MNENYQNPPLLEGQQGDGEIDWALYIGRALKHKWFIIIFSFIFFVLGCFYALNMKRKWGVSVVMAPEVQTATKSMGGFSNIASMLGIGNASLANSTDALNITLFPEICSSSPFLTSLFNVPVTTYVSPKKKKEGVKPFGPMPLYDFVLEKYKPKSAFSLWLESFFEKEEEEGPDTLNPTCLTKEQGRVLKALSRCISASVDNKSGITTLNVTMSDPLIATQLADTVCRRLQEYVVQYRTQKAGVDYEYYKEMSAESYEKMVKAQAAYAASVDYDRSVILQSVNSEKQRLQQEASLAQQLYSQMKQQEEMAKAKVQEMKPVYAIIQPATQPLRPSNSRAKTALGWGFFGFILSAGWKIFLKDYLAEFKAKLKKEDETTVIESPETTV